MPNRAGHLLLDADQCVVHACAAAHELLRHGSGTLVGRPLDALLRLPPHCGCGSPSNLAGAQARTHAVLSPPSDGPDRHFDMHIAPLEGNARLWLVRLEAPLDPAPPPALLDGLTNCPGLHWALLDRELGIVQASDAFMNRFGAARGLPLPAFFTSPELHAALHQAMAQGVAHELAALPFIRAHGCGTAPTSFWDVHVQPLTGPEADGGTLLYLQDVSEAQELRKRLAANSQFTSEVLHNAPDAVCIATRDRVLLVNRAMQLLLGDLTDPAQIHEQVRPVNGQSLEWFALARPEPDWLTPIECTAREGNARRELHVYVRPITFEGQPSLLYAMRDLTTERRLERQLLRSHKLEALGQISASVSHEFGNLLTLLAFDAEQARAERGAEDRSALLDAISKTTGRAQQLVREVMQFTREDTSDTLVDLADSVRKLQPILERSVGRDRVLTFDLPAGSTVAPLAAVHVEQIVLNLLLNARDATSPGDAIAVLVRESDGGTAEIHVRDHGSGMSDEVASHIFEPYFTTKNEGDGAGLGLAVVGDVVRRAGGRVRVQSEPGKGTHVVVELPTATPPSTQTTEGGPAHGSERVAVCYPDEELRDAMTRSLALLGYGTMDCTTCQIDGPRPAIDAWIVHENHCESLMSRLRPDGSDRPTAMVCITDSSASNLDAQTRDAARVQILTKPFTPVELARALRRCLD